MPDSFLQQVRPRPCHVQCQQCAVLTHSCILQHPSRWAHSRHSPRFVSRSAMRTKLPLDLHPATATLGPLPTLVPNAANGSFEPILTSDAIVAKRHCKRRFWDGDRVCLANCCADVEITVQKVGIRNRFAEIHWSQVCLFCCDAESIEHLPGHDVWKRGCVATIRIGPRSGRHTKCNIKLRGIANGIGHICASPEADDPAWRIV